MLPRTDADAWNSLGNTLLWTWSQGRTWSQRTRARALKRPTRCRYIGTGGWLVELAAAAAAAGTRSRVGGVNTTVLPGSTCVEREDVVSLAALRRGGSAKAAPVAATMTGAGEGSGQQRQLATRPRGVLGSGCGGIATLTAVKPQQQSRRTAKAVGMAADGACSLRSCDDGAGDASVGFLY